MSQESREMGWVGVIERDTGTRDERAADTLRKSQKDERLILSH